ncbi:hypothetical protein CTA1_11907 [Colletotrichum tanaceti]|uniref:Uncharacterized protein n=1 Tax=Colletotrichum tanaceti TaxID=1306861 RepID=A0A4U6XKX9_9PEZI|nr:hypothetical protein CTA1_11907 [Colletotrichum tanaceti]
MPSTPDPSLTFPQRGVVAYHTTHGPIHAPTLAALDALRARPDYDSCMPLLSDHQLSVDWDAIYFPFPYTPSSYPYSPSSLSSLAPPLRTPQAEIDAMWDPYQLHAMTKRSQHDLAALRRRLLDVERAIHDADRVNSNARLGETGVYSESRARPAATAVKPGARSRRATLAAERTVPVEYELSSSWDVYKLREVFSQICGTKSQRDA